MIGYIFALLPLYILVYLPISQILNGSPQTSTRQQTLSFNESFIAVEEPVSCPPHSYNTFILSHEPLIIYIENFLSGHESEHLLNISEDKFEPATVTTGEETSIRKDVRFSEVALLDRDDVVRCIENRARAFQGWQPNLHIERLRTQRYGIGGHYKHHFDWSGASRDADRMSTFMVYVDADCEGGGTEFPRGGGASFWTVMLVKENEATIMEEKKWDWSSSPSKETRYFGRIYNQMAEDMQKHGMQGCQSCRVGKLG
ncbi:Procollagen-proline [Hyphodiscus hymeniophilus]|uniref:Procollagen-proline n=1 Tax=Hyphodiscus hymeniophilus TaxID=353542 RepID=A0A9P6VGP1_9HELO|nr:Procollagen-proline [Hyphodiscus hymeniophilus]